MSNDYLSGMLIQSLNDLKTALDNCKTRRDYVALAKNIRLNNDHFNGMTSWDTGHYTRNCVYRTDQYELLLLCWENGQDTPIHCHSGEECWVYMVDGAIREERYKFPDHHKPELTHDQVYNSGQVSYINDDMGVHRLINTSGNRTMSLHLYVGPIEQCRVFDQESGEYVWKELHYDRVAEII